MDDARRRLGGRADCQFVIQFGQLHLTDLFQLFCFRPQKFRIRIPRWKSSATTTTKKQTNKWIEATFSVQSCRRTSTSRWVLRFMSLRWWWDNVHPSSLSLSLFLAEFNKRKKTSSSFLVGLWRHLWKCLELVQHPKNKTKHIGAWKFDILFCFFFCFFFVLPLAVSGRWRVPRWHATDEFPFPMFLNGRQTFRRQLLLRRVPKRRLSRECCWMRWPLKRRPCHRKTDKN